MDDLRERQRRTTSAKAQAQTYFDGFPDDTAPVPILFGDGDVVVVRPDGSADYFTAEEYRDMG